MDTNISLKDLVKIIDDHQKKYNDDEEKKYNDDEIEFFKTILLSFSENEWSDKDKHLSEFKGLLHDLNELLDKEDVSSTDIIDRRYLDTRLVLLKNNILGAIKFEKPAKKNSTQSNTKKNSTQSNAKKNSTQSNAKENGTQSNTKENDVDPGRIMHYFDSRNEDKSNKIIKTQRGVIIISSIALLASLFATGYVLIKDAKSDKNKDDNNSGKFSMSRISQRLKDTRMYYDSKNNEAKVLVEDEELVLVEEEDKPLTTENFENLVSVYANKYNKEYDGIVTTKDIVKFASIANIDLLSEENRELANELFGEQTKEEYLSDAAKLIGATVMYNFKEWNKSLSTDNFIRVSDVVYGEQKDKMLKIEEYTDKIANAVNAEDADLTNEIISEFLTDMNSGSLSKLDDGVGFAAQVNIAVIADGIARDFLNKENFDMFQILKTSEKYVSNIFTEYEECTNDNDNVKTLTK